MLKILPLKTCVFLPKAQPEMALSILHISYFLQNCKKGKPSKKNLPYLKTISQQFFIDMILVFYSRNLQFSPKNWDG